MNYIKLYETFINYCQRTTPFARLRKRNPKDLRIVNNSELYVEGHHIIPKSVGGSNNTDNIVTLLPEEHLFAHLIRYKAYGERCDFIAIKFVINGFNGKKKLKNIKTCLNRKIRNSYAWMRQNSSSFRKTNGWQTKEGKHRISISRKGTFPVKDVLTGEIVGSVEKNHPKVVSGEWVHHSKGKHKFFNKKTGEGRYCNKNDLDNIEDWVSASNKDDQTTGTNNPKYSGITDDEIYDFYVKVASVIAEKYQFNELPGLKLIKLIWDEKHKFRKFPNLGGGAKSGFRFNGDVKNNLISPVCKELNLEYNRYNKMRNKINVKEVLDAIN